MDKTDFIFGLRPVMEALEAGKNIDKLYIKRELTGEAIRFIIKRANALNVPVQKVPAEKLDRITRKNHQGIIAQISPVSYHDLDNLIISLYESGKNPMGIVLDGITDAGNFGAIARSAECAGADFIVIPERGSASVTSDAVRASAGALLYIPVCRVKKLTDGISLLKNNGFKIVGATEKSKIPYTSLDFTVPVIIVMGAENSGISEECLKKCDEFAAIPIKGHVGSLNVSVAAGIMLYEAVKQRSR